MSQIPILSEMQLHEKSCCNYLQWKSHTLHVHRAHSYPRVVVCWYCQALLKWYLSGLLRDFLLSGFADLSNEDVVQDCVNSCMAETVWPHLAGNSKPCEGPWEAGTILPTAPFVHSRHWLTHAHVVCLFFGCNSHPNPMKMQDLVTFVCKVKERSSLWYM